MGAPGAGEGRERDVDHGDQARPAQPVPPVEGPDAADAPAESVRQRRRRRGHRPQDDPALVLHPEWGAIVSLRAKVLLLLFVALSRFINLPSCRSLRPTSSCSSWEYNGSSGSSGVSSAGDRGSIVETASGSASRASSGNRMLRSATVDEDDGWSTDFSLSDEDMPESYLDHVQVSSFYSLLCNDINVSYLAHSETVRCARRLRAARSHGGGSS